jgi:hypothetical protein
MESKMNAPAIKKIRLQQKLKLSDFFQINKPSPFVPADWSTTFHFSADIDNLIFDSFGAPLLDNNKRLYFFQHREPSAKIKLTILKTNQIRICSTDDSIKTVFFKYLSDLTRRINNDIPISVIESCPIWTR